jgi:hypothetical protein
VVSCIHYFWFSGEGLCVIWKHFILASTAALHGSGCQVAMVTKYGMVAHDVCGPSVWLLQNFTLLMPQIMRLLKFWKLSAPLLYSIMLHISVIVLCVVCRMSLGCTLFVHTELTANT